MKKYALGVLLTVSGLPALAEISVTPELLVGKADQSTDVNGSKVTDGDDTSLGLRAVFGINKNLDVEVAYQDYGETDDTYVDSFGDTINDKFSTSALNVGLKGIAPFSDKLAFHGRVGLARWDTELKSTDSSSPGQTLSLDDNGVDIYYGVGVQYNLTPKLNVGMEYDITEMDVSFSGLAVDHTVKNLSLSLGYDL